MYESPAYWELQKTISHWESMRRYADLARTFRTMAYDQSLTLETKNTSPCDQREGHSITIGDTLKNKLLRLAAEHCEELAVQIAAEPPKSFDIAAACRV